MPEITLPVRYVPQQVPTTCWAASTAMLLNYRDGTDRDDRAVCQEYGLDTGASPSALADVARYFGLQEVPSSSMPADGWVTLLQQTGPLLVQVPGNSHHSIVVAGASTEHGIYVLDPWEGEGWMSFEEFEGKFEAAAMRILDEDGKVVRWEWPFGNLYRI